MGNRINPKNTIFMVIRVVLVLMLIQVLVRCDDDDKKNNNDDQSQVTLREVADGLVSPLFLTESPDNSGRLFVGDQTGVVYIIRNDSILENTPFLDIKDKLVDLNPGYDERGLLGFAFHPDFANNGKFYVYYSAPLRESAPDSFNNTSVISEFTVSGNAEVADAGSERVLMMVDQPQGNHNAGTLAFGPDGYLYISLGDGGGRDDEQLGHVEDWYSFNAGGNGQDITENLLGSILRIDVNGEEAYGIPSDNPFVGKDGMDEIYAFGFRNPYRFSFDMGGNHRLYAGDAGQDLWEEVDVVEKGGNYGWNVKEGTHCFSAENPESPPDSCPQTDERGNELIDPVIEFKNSEKGGEGIVVIGGYVYRGNDLDTLNNMYIFGAWSVEEEKPTGVIFMADINQSGLWDFEKVGLKDGFDHYLLGFGQDMDGEIYVLATDNSGPSGTSGKVYKMVQPGK